jgi:hypothetical protein
MKICQHCETKCVCGEEQGLVRDFRNLVKYYKNETFSIENYIVWEDQEVFTTLNNLDIFQRTIRKILQDSVHIEWLGLKLGFSESYIQQILDYFSNNFNELKTYGATKNIHPFDWTPSDWSK